MDEGSREKVGDNTPVCYAPDAYKFLLVIALLHLDAS
jgi:hypothetical protein